MAQADMETETRAIGHMTFERKISSTTTQGLYTVAASYVNAKTGFTASYFIILNCNDFTQAFYNHNLKSLVVTRLGYEKDELAIECGRRGFARTFSSVPGLYVP